MFRERSGHGFIHILPGDRIKIDVSRYDSNGGHIISRLHTKDSTAETVFHIPFMRIQFTVQKFQETYFRPVRKVEVDSKFRFS